MTLVSSQRARQLLSAATIALVLAGASGAKEIIIDSPLSADAQSTLSKAARLMKSGKYEKAKPSVLGLVESATDVPKCLAIAEATEEYAYPMMEVRRDCLNKALSLCQTPDDFLLVALKSRQYQFFEITRQAIGSLIANAKTMSQLYDLAKKSQEVALNDVAHTAMEKAFTGLKTQEEAFQYADLCHGLGLDDLLRKTIKQMLDDEDSPPDLCDLCLRMEKYNMRDQIRYAMRKALDKCGTNVPDYQVVRETARRLNEPDIQARADFFVRKGTLIQKIKEDRAAHDGKLRAWREQQDLAAARARDAQRRQQLDQESTGAAGFGTSNPKGATAGAASQRPSSGY